MATATQIVLESQAAVATLRDACRRYATHSKEITAAFVQPDVYVALRRSVYVNRVLMRDDPRARDAMLVLFGVRLFPMDQEEPFVFSWRYA